MSRLRCSIALGILFSLTLLLVFLPPHCITSFYSIELCDVSGVDETTSVILVKSPSNLSVHKNSSVILQTQLLQQDQDQDQDQEQEQNQDQDHDQEQDHEQDHEQEQGQNQEEEQDQDHDQEQEQEQEQGQAEVRIPSKEWIAQQMDVAYSALHSNFTPPSRWAEVTIPQSYYFPRSNIFLTAIPKNGCSNWKVALLRAEGVLGELEERKIAKNPEWVHGLISHPYRAPQFPFSWNGTYDDRIKSARSVLVLRNPWVRAVSAFRQKLSSEETAGGTLWGLQKSIVEHQRGRDTWRSRDDSPTFEEFIRYSIRIGGIMDKHFKPQWRYIEANKTRYEHIVPLELAGRMIRPLFAQLGLEDTQLMGSYDNSSDPRDQSSAHMARVLFGGLPPALVEKFYAIYHLDFLLLNYSNFTDADFPLPKGYD